MNKQEREARAVVAIAQARGTMLEISIGWRRAHHAFA
jgi:hypothetical protein